MIYKDTINHRCQIVKTTTIMHIMFTLKQCILVTSTPYYVTHYANLLALSRAQEIFMACTNTTTHLSMVISLLRLFFRKLKASSTASCFPVNLTQLSSGRGITITFGLLLNGAIISLNCVMPPFCSIREFHWLSSSFITLFGSNSFSSVCTCLAFGGFFLGCSLTVRLTPSILLPFKCSAANLAAEGSTKFT